VTFDPGNEGTIYRLDFLMDALLKYVTFSEKMMKGRDRELFLKKSTTVFMAVESGFSAQYIFHRLLLRNKKGVA
jgi:hypothetical protein